MKGWEINALELVGFCNNVRFYVLPGSAKLI